MSKRYEIKKVPDMFYFDYMIEKGFCYVFQETKDDRVHTKKVCATDKKKREEFSHNSTSIFITI